jgi:hydrogenase maturation factor
VGSTDEKVVAALFSDLSREANAIGVSVIGGHTEITAGIDRPLLIGTMLGETSTAGLIDPSSAQPGDRLLMTGTAGIEGTALLAGALANRLSSSGWTLDELHSATSMLDDPGISVVTAARALTDAGVAVALHDPTEGGISSALREMAIAADCGAFVSFDAISVDPRTARLCRDLNIDPLGLLASGSLLAAIRTDDVEAAEAALEAHNIPYAWIGKLTPTTKGFRMRRGIFDGPLPEFAIDEVARILAE